MSTNLLKKPIIFIGVPRSGTTIISEMIFRHRDLGWPSSFQEKLWGWSSVEYLRRLVDNKYWRMVGNKKQLHQGYLFNKFLFKPSESYRTWSRLTDKDYTRSFLINEEESPENRLKIRKYFSRIVKAQGKKRLAFKNTGPPRIGYLLSIFPDAAFVLIKRKPIPTINSLLKVGFWQESGKKQLWWYGPYTDTEKKWAEENRHNAILLTTLQLRKIYWAQKLEILKYNPSLLEIKYEDFVTQPQLNINRILEYSELSFDGQIKKYLEKNPLISRNKSDSSYFDKETINKINRILAGELV